MTGRQIEQEEVEQGPGHVYSSFIIMEDLLDKLKLLNYEKEIVMTLKMRPLNRHYFVLGVNGCYKLIL